MNKKLKIYTTLFIASLLILIVTNVFDFDFRISGSDDTEKLEVIDKPGWAITVDTIRKVETIDSIPGGVRKTSRYETVTKTGVSTAFKNVAVRPKLTSNKAIVSTCHDKSYKLDMERVKIEMPEFKAKSVPYTVCVVLLMLVDIVVFGWILVLVFKLIRRIRRGEVFVAKVSKYMEKAGILLVANYLLELLIYFCITEYLKHNIHLAEYDIVFENECNYMYIITGFVLMIISQIILMGKELKDEHDLTI